MKIAADQEQHLVGVRGEQDRQVQHRADAEIAPVHVLAAEVVRGGRPQDAADRVRQRQQGDEPAAAAAISACGERAPGKKSR